jgi:predicted RecB family nuclease
MPQMSDVSMVTVQGGYIAKQCPVVIQNRVLVPTEEAESPPEAIHRMDAGIEFEAVTLESLRGEGPDDWVLIPQQSRSTAIEATIDAMGRGAAVIENAFLPIDEEGRRSGRPDLLIRSDAGYIPVDIKHHRTINEDEASVLVSDPTDPFYESAHPMEGWDLRKHQGDALQLAHYHRMLEAAGHDSGRAIGGILGKEGLIVWYDLDAPMWTTPAKSDGKKRKKRTSLERYDFEFGFRLDIAATAHSHLEDDDVELLVESRASGECDECGFHDFCWATLELGSGDSSLLPGLNYQQWRHLRDLGITERSQIADLNYPTASLMKSGVEVDVFLELAEGEDPSVSLESLRPRAKKQLLVLEEAGVRTVGDLLRVTDLDTAAVGGFIAKRILDARAALGPHPVYRRPGVDEVTVPRADIEIDIDMENVNEGVYLWGALINDRTKPETKPEYIPFVSWEPIDDEVELEVFLAMWNWLTAQRDRAEENGMTMKAYVWYEPAENHHLRRISGAANRRLEEQVEILINSDVWVDLKRVFENSWITGGSVGLKSIAPLAGFEWGVDDPGGGLSMVKYHEAVAEESEAADASREWILDYNRGDVEATSAIRDWLSTEGAGWPEVDVR